MWTPSRAGRRSATSSRIPWDSPRHAERRKSNRYPIRMKLRFTVPRPQGGGPRVIRSGRSIDISRHGILFTFPEPLTVGQMMEGSIFWPVPRAGGIPVKLEVKGAVVRSESGRIALQIARHEFRAVRATAPLARAGGSSQ
jgi:PilZ domain